jgi:hypothetical protein
MVNALIAAPRILRCDEPFQEVSVRKPPMYWLVGLDSKRRMNFIDVVLNEQAWPAAAANCPEQRTRSIFLAAKIRRIPQRSMVTC